MTFSSAVDVCNRAAQHCGVARISDFSEDSLPAQEFNFVYDKLRRAELRRNVWAFATRKACLRPAGTGVMLISPVMWSSTTTYTFGSLVTDVSGIIWQSRLQDNTNNPPGVSTAWDVYTGPMMATLYDSTGATGYYAGEMVYETPGDGTYKVYMAVQSGVSNDPSVSTAWVSTTQYSKDQVVVVGSTYYVSLIDFNTNQNPPSAPALWVSTTAYTTGQTVGGSDGFIYTASANNTGKDPTLTTGYWTNTGVLNPWSTVNPFGKADNNWLQMNVTLVDPMMVYPLGSGPSQQAATRNIFRLPANFLRAAPQDPKAGSVSFLGAPTGLMYDDWEYENNYIISREVYPIVYRFVADVTDVTAFDDMFCEGLAARIALETVERLTQSTAKLGSISAMYKQFMTEARTVNGIETGPTEPPEDDYVTCRI